MKKGEDGDDGDDQTYSFIKKFMMTKSHRISVFVSYKVKLKCK